MGECVISSGTATGGYCCGELIMCLVSSELAGSLFSPLVPGVL